MKIKIMIMLITFFGLSQKLNSYSTYQCEKICPGQCVCQPILESSLGAQECSCG